MTLPAGISVVVPVYNAALTIRELCARCASVLDEMGERYEIILVNDGSSDASWVEIERITADRPEVTGIDFARNCGQHNALLAGVLFASLDTVVTLDDDLQNPPEEIPRLVARLHEGFDVVYGAPESAQHGLLRNLASRITKIVLQNAMGADTARSISAFRAFHTALRDAFRDVHEPFVNLDVLLTWGGGAFTSITVRHEPRTTGASNYTSAKLVTHAFNMMTGFSLLPLRIASYVGFMMAGFGGVLLAFVLFAYFFRGPAVQGFAFLASVMCLFGGAQLLAIGIVGEYLARTHFRTMGRPPFFIRRTTRRAPVALP